MLQLLNDVASVSGCLHEFLAEVHHRLGYDSVFVNARACNKVRTQVLHSIIELHSTGVCVFPVIRFTLMKLFVHGNIALLQNNQQNLICVVNSAQMLYLSKCKRLNIAVIKVKVIYMSSIQVKLPKYLILNVVTIVIVVNKCII